MEQLTWSTSMSVGNAFLDAEHKKLLSMIDDVETAIREKDVAALSQSLKTFDDAVRIHFGNEARIAAAIGHPFDQHQTEHQYVLDEIQQMESELVDTAGRWSESASIHYLIFLSSWASEHIGHDDMLMKPRLQTYPYDFKPDNLAAI